MRGGWRNIRAQGIPSAISSSDRRFRAVSSRARIRRRSAFRSFSMSQGRPRGSILEALSRAAFLRPEGTSKLSLKKGDPPLDAAASGWPLPPSGDTMTRFWAKGSNTVRAAA